jgi:hypothetical protein
MDDEVTDYFTISGRPQLTMADPWLTIPCVTGKDIRVYGSWFTNVSGIFASGTPGVFPDAPSGTPLSAISGVYNWYYDPFIANSGLSAMYPGFSAVEIANWNVVNDNTLTIELPRAVSGGYIDIIAYNEAGYGLLTRDAVRPTLNPYPTSTPEFSAYVEYQHPSVSGIYVAPFYYNC